MKKAFTLVELLIVIVVISIMMGMVMRFGNISEDSRKRNATISQLQRVENALSGYYAAFGTYPPVGLHGSRNIYLVVSNHGIQNTEGKENTSLWGWLGSDGKVSNARAEVEAWEQVEAACKSQPVACYFPYSAEEGFRNFVDSYSATMKSWASQASEKELSDGRRAVLMAGFDTGVPLGRFASYRGEIDWEKIQLFKFGLLSFLLPRYLFMMEGPEELFTDYAQWTGNNQLPNDPLRGTTYAGGWKRLRADVNDDLARVANIPSQAVCARWIANFENSLSCGKKTTFFGVNVQLSAANVLGEESEEGETVEIKKDIPVFSPGGYSQSSSSGQYTLDMISIADGWGNDLYYYSPAPYQSYVLWSAGPNARTFPPWISRDSLNADASRCVGYWIADDIVSLRH